MKQGILKKIYEYGLCLVVLILVLSAFGKLLYFNISAPVGYNYDSLFSLAYVKSIIEHSVLDIPYHIGYPNGYFSEDFPIMDSFSAGLIILISKFSGTTNPFLLVNIYYLGTFILVAWSALFVFRYYQINYPLALAGAIVFALMPYHFYRSTMHLFLSNYFTIPLWSLICLELYHGNRVSFLKKSFLNFWLLILVLIMLATNGVYYLFFGCFFVLISGCLAYIAGNRQALLTSILITASSGIVFFVQLLPMLISNNMNGRNIEAVIRSPLQTEIYGLRISHLLLPSEYHRVKLFADISYHFDSIFAMDYNESIYSHLGIVSSVGFIFLILIILVPQIRRCKSVQLLSTLNLMAVLFAVTGGFAVLFSFAVSDLIRSVNRVSIFIAFFSILSLLLYINKIKVKPYYYQKLSWLISCFAIYLAAIDQINPHAFDNRYLAIKAKADADFVARIERVMPSNSAIWELPYMDYPEPQIISGNMGTYEPFIPYLYSQSLYWSYGATKGRPIAKWQEITAKLPLDKMLDKIAAAGYSGVLIDMAGYSSESGENLVRSLKQIIQKEPLTSMDKQFVFYKIR